VDVPEEMTRLKKEIQKTESELKKLSGKLGNKNFLEKAPPEIVEKNKRIYNELSGKKEKFEDALNLFQRSN